MRRKGLVGASRHAKRIDTPSGVSIVQRPSSILLYEGRDPGALSGILQISPSNIPQTQAGA
jgi:hypothetical protein